MKQNQMGFTMIEILAVILIVSVLGAGAMAKFLDFRKEAAYGATQHKLGALRSAIHIKQMQVTNLCPNSTFEQRYLQVLRGIQFNDVAQPSNMLGWDTLNFCWSGLWPLNNVDRSYFSHNEELSLTTYQKNFLGNAMIPYFKTPAQPTVDNIIWVVSQSDIDAAGGRCGYVGTGGWVNAHWIGIRESGQIFPGTNTLGFNECNL